MKHYARFNSTDFVITELPKLDDSSRESKFSNLEIDFRNYDESLLPIQYQEIQIIQIDDELNETNLMTGYVESIEYPEFEFDDQTFLLTINLLSPYAYASKRSVSTQINAEALNTSIETVLQPLIDDGFAIQENDLTDDLVSEIFQNETVEKVMNYLASKFDFVWHIDKAKKIYLKDAKLLKGQVPVIEINDDNRYYLQKIQPSKTVVDYANRLNIKNVTLIGEWILLSAGTVLTKGETYSLIYPFSVSENTCFRLPKFDLLSPENTTYPFWLPTESGTNLYLITVDLDAKTITYDPEIGISGIDDNDPTKKILLVSDPNDTTKITGFKWNATSETIGTAGSIGFVSASVLAPYQITYIDPVEIDKIKAKTNTSGVIEKIIDANGKYFTSSEIETYAINLFSQNNVQTNEIDCVFKGRLDDADFQSVLNLLKITKVFSVDLPKFQINGSFIITDVSYTANTHTATLKINARNYNLNESYLDIYRSKLTQESEDTLTRKMLTFYNQDNKTILSKDIYVNGVKVNAESN